MATLRKGLRIREQEIEAMEEAYKALYNLLAAPYDFSLEHTDMTRKAIDKLYNALNGVPE